VLVLPLLVPPPLATSVDEVEAAVDDIGGTMDEEADVGGGGMEEDRAADVTVEMTLVVACRARTMAPSTAA
jgi:hypothetical protein